MNKFLEGIEKIEASDALRKKIKRSFARSRAESVIKGACSTVAAVMAVVVLGVNISPSFAYAMSEVPTLEKIVRVVTFARYEGKIGSSEAEIVTPKIEGLKDEELMEEINRALGERAEKLAAEFEKEAAELMEEYGEDAHMGFESSYIVKCDSEDYYAIDVYFVNTVGSSSTTHTFYTIDKKTGELVTLKGLFSEGSDYKGRLGKIIGDEMLRRNAEEEGMYWVGEDDAWQFEGIGEDAGFYINNEGNLVICFDKYEVAAGAQGSPEFVIDRAMIEDILK